MAVNRDPRILLIGRDDVTDERFDAFRDGLGLLAQLCFPLQSTYEMSAVHRDHCSCHVGRGVGGE